VLEHGGVRHRGEALGEILARFAQAGQAGAAGREDAPEGRALMSNVCPRPGTGVHGPSCLRAAFQGFRVQVFPLTAPGPFAK
jgi:hypothetical protein